MARKSRNPQIEILDKRFLICVGEDIDLKRIWTGGIWTEGPAWLERNDEFVWADIPNNRMLAWKRSDAHSSRVSQTLPWWQWKYN